MQAIALAAAIAWLAPPPANTGLCMSSEEASLVELTNTYRIQNGKTALPASKWVATTGQYHAWDLGTNSPVGGSCNLHSWSAAMPLLWQAMCYTPDHAQAAQMWAKPRQISQNLYTGNGYEIAAQSGTSIGAAAALAIWQQSPSHVDVILQRGIWAGVPFQNMGVGIFGSFAVAWFGVGADAITMLPCPSDNIFRSGFE